MKVRLHGYEPASRANGLGLRAALWFQGCTIRCPGCFNPETHDPDGGYDADTAEIARAILSNGHGIEGLSISGGELFEQPEALLDLVERVRAGSLSLLVFSGLALEHIRALRLGPAVLGRIDVLIAGPYRLSRHRAKGLLGSSNQRIHLLTARYRPADLALVPQTEVILHRDGTATISGVAPLLSPLAGEDDNHGSGSLRQ